MISLDTQIKKSSSNPAHLQVRDRLLGLIKAGELAPGDKLPSEPEIADRLGVSRMTANKAILSLVAEGWLTREKGRGTFVAPTPQGLQKCAVAMVPDDIPGVMEDYYFGALYWSLQSKLSQNGVPVDIALLNEGISDRLSQGTGLIAINPPEKFVPELQASQRKGIPTVILGSSWKDCGIATIDSDNLLGPAIAVNHLAELGHRDVIFLGAYPNDSNTQDRIRGFRTAMKSRQLQATAGDEFITSEFIFNDQEVRQILDRINAGATAVFAAGPRIAMQMLVVAQKHNISVPGRLSIVGYDDPGYLSMAHPALTTIRQPLQEMAVLAYKTLLEQYRTGSVQPSVHILDPEIIVRYSTSPLTHKV